MWKRKPLVCSLLVVMIFFPVLLALGQAGQTAKEQTNPLFVNPPALSKPNGYTHVVILRSDRLIYVSGQVALNPEKSWARTICARR